MREFFTIVKKDIRDVWRTKKFLLYFLIAMAMTVFCFLLMGIMQIVIKYAALTSAPEKLKAMFQLTTSNSMMFFSMFISSYFMIAVVIFIRNVVSKEIAENKWTLPLQAGIKPWKLVFSKILVYVVSIMVALICAFALHFVLTLIICKPTATNPVTNLPYDISYGAAVGNMIYSYVMLLVGMIFIMVAVITLNAITKKSWPAIIVPLAILMIMAPICDAVKAGSKSLSHYLPFLFFNESSYKTGTAGALEFVIASLVTFAICALLVFWAVRKTKVVGLQDKRLEE